MALPQARALMPALQKYRIRSTVLAALVRVAAVLCVTFGILATSQPVMGLAGIGALATFIAFALARQRWRNNGTLDLDEDGATVRGPGVETKVPRSAIDTGFARGDRELVLQLRGGTVIEGTLDESPERTLAHLGLTLERAAISAPLRGVLGSFTRGLLAFFGGWFVALTFLLWIGPVMVPVTLGLAAIFTLAVVRYLRPRLVVGVDGVRVTGVLRPRFYPYSAIERVRSVTYGQYGENGIAIDGAFGTRVFPTIGQSHEQVMALMDRIEEGRRRYTKQSSRKLDLLDRNARDLAAWKNALQAMTAGGFRDAALGRDDLEEVLLDPKAPLERRVGAALALRDDEEGRARIRVAAETSADPRVRVALEEASADEIDEASLLRRLDER